MPITNHYDLDIDTTLGGNNASDYVIPSQKAIKDYVDNSTGGNVMWGNIAGTLSNQTDLASALNDKYDASNPNGYTSNVGTVTSVNNVSPVNGNVTLSIPAAQVNSDWDAVSGVAQILNKPTIPTAVSQLTNDSGYITGITGTDVTTALGYTPYNSSNPNGYTSVVESTVSGWGFTKNAGTVTSVNNVSPVNGNVSLTIPTVNNATLTITQGGTTKGTFTANASSDVTIALDAGGSVDIDNKSITTNSDDELQTVGVIDNNNTTNAIKTWTGTKAQYDAIVTKDANTLYNITDDTDVTLPLLELLFPVGAVYFGTMSVCPLQTLGVGTWQALPQDKVIQIAGTRGSVGTTLAESLPNITGTLAWVVSYTGGASGAFKLESSNNSNSGSGSNVARDFSFDASRSSATYQNNAPVQQDAYLLNGWRRIA